MENCWSSGQPATVENGDDFALVRYNTDGSLDAGFGVGWHRGDHHHAPPGQD